MPNFSLEDQFKGYVAGLDEAGCGPWAGPVTAAALVFDRSLIPERLLNELRDSKKLSESKRLELYGILLKEKNKSCWWAISEASVCEIDRLNIRAAALLAMHRAFEELGIQVSAALVDGIVKPTLACPTLTVKKGDDKSLSIAAASILAKVTRDRTMKELALDFPGYGWERNAGYGTKEHSEALVELGVTPHHRRSFSPIKMLLAA